MRKQTMSFMLGIFFVSISYPLSAHASVDWPKIEKSVARIICVGQSGASTGTGWAISDDGHWITNHHVIDCVSGGGRLVIGFAKDDLEKASVVWSDKNLDLAILKTELIRDALPILVSSAVRSRDGVTAIGFPGVADKLADDDASLFVPSSTPGAVSRLVNNNGVRKVIQHTAALNPGNSGGPLVNECGEVVGINTYGPNFLRELLTTGQVPQGVGFAVSVDELIPHLNREGIKYSISTKHCEPEVGELTSILMVEIVAGAMIAAMVGYGVSPKGRIAIGNTIAKVNSRSGSSRDTPQKNIPIANEKSGSAVAKITGVAGEYAGVSFVLTKSEPEIRIGREPSLCNIVITKSDVVSKSHVRIFFNSTSNCLFAEDSYSKNGTTIVRTNAGEKKKLSLKPKSGSISLENGDEIQLGNDKTSFTVLWRHHDI